MFFLLDKTHFHANFMLYPALRIFFHIKLQTSQKTELVFMDKQKIESFAKLPLPPQSEWGFIEDIKSPLEYHFDDSRGCDAGENKDCLANGVRIVMEFTGTVPETAFKSLRRVLNAKGIPETDNGYPLIFRDAADFEHEEFELATAPESAVIRAKDTDGIRRGVYALEDQICAAAGKALMPCSMRKKPFVKHRISRCFFGPTYRPPFFIDELTNDIDYYPEEYLNKLAHEGVNGLWLTVYLRDYPTAIMPGHGKDAEKRYAKLKQVAQKCLAYGIRIYLFMSEPKIWGTEYFTLPESDAALHPELIGFHIRKWGFFCTSTDAGKQYFRDTVGGLFSHVPELGGIINIMYGEDNGCCVSSHQIYGETPENEYCPRCSKRTSEEVHAELASVINETMRKYNPDAEYIGWFYAPGQKDGSHQSERLRSIAEAFPEDCTFMLNFESGGKLEQLGKERRIQDYSLAYVGPSKLFADSTKRNGKTGAKLQVGCSHEDASVPFIPVPENLYDKYHFMKENGVTAAMQCWYFGNYPGLMNRAAGALSFLPFKENAMEFLEELARPEWRKDAPEVAAAWHEFSMAYRNFPGNIAFEWYGPLHNCIVWPLHLFPVNEPIAPSWILKQYPEVSGDRIGETLGFGHTIAEALTLCQEMNQLWQKGMKRLQALIPFYQNNPPRLADISLSGAVGLQIKSCCNLLEFYLLREEMFYTKQNHLARMMEIVKDEIANTEEMLSLCRKDHRLGYHSEAEGFLFYPEKLEGRIELLKDLLEKDFPAFDINAPELDEYTGRVMNGKVAHYGEKNLLDNGTSWLCRKKGDQLCFELEGMKDKDCTVALEMNRIHPPIKVKFTKEGHHMVCSNVYPATQNMVIRKENDLFTFEVDLKLYADFMREGVPLRINVIVDDTAWVKHEPLPSRLMFGDTNWNCAGWLTE